MGKSKKVYILTNFSQYLKSYSPIIVVQSQLDMFLRNGYQPVLITNRGWNPPETSIFMQVQNEQLTPVNIDGTTVDEAFEKEVDTVYNELKKIIDDNSIVITHDLIFLPDYVKHNVAARRLAGENDSIQWLHWIHSATSPGILIEERAMYGEKYKEHLSSKFPNSIVCFPNSYDIPRVAKNFGFEEDEVVEVPHATDVSSILRFAPVFQRLYNDKRLFEAEVLMCYPIRLDRGKQPEMNIRLIAGLREVGLTAHLVICDFQSTGGDKVTYREELKTLAKEKQVENCVTFLSEYDESASMEVDNDYVKLFQTMCNFFMLPSKSETYSLVAQEAMGYKNFCILNHDFAPMRSIYGKSAIYRQFSSNIAFDGQDGEINTEYSDIDVWFRDLATNVKYWLEADKAIRGATWVRVYRHPDYVFKEYVEPLLTKETEGIESVEIQEAEVLDSDASLQRARAIAKRSVRDDALQGEISPESN